MEKEDMGGHVMVPLESLSLELPKGEIVVGYDKDISALQGWSSISLHTVSRLSSDGDFALRPDGVNSIPCCFRGDFNSAIKAATS
jgi:hypothetical protein